MPKFYRQGLMSKSQHSQTQPEMEEDFLEDDSDPVVKIVEWRAFSRPYRAKNRSFYTTVGILVFLFSFFAWAFGELFSVFAVWALGFAIFVFNLVKPDEVTYRMTTEGITIGDSFYHWQELDSFWFAKKEGLEVLHIATNLRFPSILMLVLPPGEEDQFKKICIRFLPYREIVPKSWMDKLTEKIQAYFPLENPHH